MRPRARAPPAQQGQASAPPTESDSSLTEPSNQSIEDIRRSHANSISIEEIRSSNSSRPGSSGGALGLAGPFTQQVGGLQQPPATPGGVEEGGGPDEARAPL